MKLDFAKWQFFVLHLHFCMNLQLLRENIEIKFCFSFLLLLILFKKYALARWNEKTVQKHHEIHRFPHNPASEEKEKK